MTPASGPAFEAARKRIPACSVVARKMFAMEVDALKEGLGCANVVQLLDCRTTATHHEILLELLRGGMLGDELVSKVPEEWAGGRTSERASGWRREVGCRTGLGYTCLTTGCRTGSPRVPHQWLRSAAYSRAH